MRLEPETPSAADAACASVRQATCRDLECCALHRCWDDSIDSRSKALKSTKLARDAARVHARGAKNHLPRAGRCTYVQPDEGRYNHPCNHRGVFKWLKRMRRASKRLPAWKEQWRAYVHARPEAAWYLHSEASDPPTDSDDYD